MIASRISDLGMQTGNPSAGLLPVGTAPGLSGQGSQLPAECGQFLFEVAGIGDMLTVAGGQKGFDATSRPAAGKSLLNPAWYRHYIPSDERFSGKTKIMKA